MGTYIHFTDEQIGTGTDSKYRHISCRMSAACPAYHSDLIHHFFGFSSHRLSLGIHTFGKFHFISYK